MRTIKLVLLFLLVLSVNTLPAQTGQPPLIDRELLFGPPQITGGQLSPDGKWMSFLKPYKSTMNVWVKKAEAPFSSARLLTADTARPIRGYFWSRDSKYILYVQDKGGDENFNVYAVRPTDQKEPGKDIPLNRALTDYKGVRTFIYAVPKSDPDAIYIGLNDRDKAWHDLYKLSISTGQKKLLRQNSATDRITGWIFDWNDQLRFATRANVDGSNELLLVEGSELKPVYKTGPFEEFNVFAFDQANQKVYMSTNKGERNLSELVLFDPQTKEETLVERDPQKKVDFGGAQFSEVRHNLLYTSYVNEKEKLYWKDKGFEQDYLRIKKALPASEINFSNSTADENKFIVTAYSDTDPGAVYLYDRKTKKLSFQYRPRPDVPVRRSRP